MLPMEANRDRYEWDEAKRLSNIEKHGIDFEAIDDFVWGTASTRASDRYRELRFIATGYIGPRLHIVVYTMRGDRMRIISVRKANTREIRNYAET